MFMCNTNAYKNNTDEGMKELGQINVLNNFCFSNSSVIFQLLFRLNSDDISCKLFKQNIALNMNGL